MADDFIQQIARLLGQSPDDTRRTLHALADTIRQDVENDGEAQIEGLGVFRRDGESLAFEPAPTLARAVNHRYAGLKALDSGAPDESETAPAADGPDEPDDAAFIADAPTADTPVAEQETAEAEIAEETVDAFAEVEAPDLELPAPEPPEPVRDLASPPEEAVGAVDDSAPSVDDAPMADAPDEPELEGAGDVIAGAGTPASDALDAALEGNTLDEDALVERHLDAPPQLSTPDRTDDEIDALLEGVWTSSSEDDGPHPLGAAPPDDVEDVDYAVVEDEPSADTPEPTLKIDGDATPAPPPAPPPEPVAAKAEPPAEDEREPLEVLVGAGTAAAAPPPPPEPHDAPGFAATAAHKDEASAPPPRERSSRAPVFLGLAAVVAIALGLFWFMNREPAPPAVAERPAPADTVAAAPAVMPADSAAQSPAESPDEPVAAAEPTTPPPAASSDPLRGSGGINRDVGGFSWVIGSELTREPAERRVAAFRAQGLRADVIAEEAGGRTRYRVALGQFDSVDEANRYRSELPAEAPADSWVLRL